MTEREKPTYPTEKQIIERALSSPRMHNLLEKKGFNLMPSYIIKPPETKPHFLEIDYLGLNSRARNALIRANITEISVLSFLSDEYLLSEIRWFGPKSLFEVRSKLENFRQVLLKKQQENPDQPVIIESLPSISERKPERIKKWLPLIDFIKTWQEEHPGRRGAQTAAAKRFGISKEWVRQILVNYPSESFKPKEAISLYQLAHQLGAKAQTIVNLLRQGKVSFGDKKIDEFYRVVRCPSVFYQLRRIPVSSVDMNKLKDELTKPQSIKWIMEQHLTRSIAERHKDTFIPLSRLARQTNMANMGNLREIPRVYDELTTAGFHLKKIPLRKHSKFYYYFAHNQEASAIITYLQEKYQPKTKVSLIFGPANAPLPTTTEFQKKNEFVSVLKTLRETTGLKLHPRSTQGILKIVFSENPVIPIYLYRSKAHQSIRISKNHLESFQKQTIAQKEQIIAFLEKRKEA